MEEIRAGIVGLDTSHSIEFTRRLQAPDCPADQKVEGMKVVNCLRFPSPFQSEPDQDKRQNQMEAWGVKMVGSMDELLKAADIILLEINEPGFHRDYFQKVADAGKPVFLDKPPADTLENAREIFRLAAEKKTRLFSASSLRFAPQVVQLSQEVSQPKIASASGALGKAPSGSSIVWYGVHTIEMIQAVMGVGAKALLARRDPLGLAGIIEYSGSRRAIFQLNDSVYRYAVSAQNEKDLKFLPVDSSRLYADLLKRIVAFAKGGEPPVSFEESIEIQAILDAIEKSVTTGKEVPVG